MKKERNVRVNVSLEGDELSLKVTEDIQAKIPRVGSKICILESYPIDDDDEKENGKVKEGAILGYSFDEKLVKATVLNDSLDAVTINGDFTIPLTEEMTLNTKKQMIFTKKEDAVEKFKSLTASSLKEVERRQKVLMDTREYLEEALEKLHH